MGRLLTDPQWWSQCSTGIRERTFQHYNKIRIDKVYNDLYVRMMARPDGPPPDLRAPALAAPKRRIG